MDLGKFSAQRGFIHPAALLHLDPNPILIFYHVVAGWCVSFLNTPAVLPGERLKDVGGRLGVGGWSAAVVIT